MLTDGFTELLPGDFRYVCYSNLMIYIEGVKCIKSFSSDKIAFAVKHGTFTVNGRDLYVDKFLLGDAVVKGQITSVQVDKL